MRLKVLNRALNLEWLCGIFKETELTNYCLKKASRPQWYGLCSDHTKDCIDRRIYSHFHFFYSPIEFIVISYNNMSFDLFR